MIKLHRATYLDSVVLHLRFQQVVENAMLALVRDYGIPELAATGTVQYRASYNTEPITVQVSNNH